MNAAGETSRVAMDSGELLGAEVVGDVLMIDVETIELGDRLRAVDEDWAAALGDIMRRDGQRTAIKVCRPAGADRWLLVAGAHRLAGAKAVGLEYLRAEVVSADALDRLEEEIAENLWRRDLDPVDRAAFVAELVQLKRTRAGLEGDARDAKVRHDLRGHHGNDFHDGSVPLARRAKAESEQAIETISKVYGWSEEVGAALGFTGRSIRNDLMIYRGVAPSLIAELRAARHPVARNATQLRALAKLPATQQRDVVERLIGGDKTVAEACGCADAKDPATKRFSAVVGNFSRMTAAEKRGVLAELRPLLPAGWRIIEGGEDA